MFNKLKQIKDLRDQAKELQGKLASEVIAADARFGKLKISMNGNMEVLSLEVDESLLGKENRLSLQKDLQGLFNDAIKKMQKTVAQKMSKEGGLPNFSDFLKG